MWCNPTYMWNQKGKTVKYIETENSTVVIRGMGGRKWEDGVQLR
jgi:hypothetical protein